MFLLIQNAHGNSVTWDEPSIPAANVGRHVKSLGPGPEELESFRCESVHSEVPG
jgi:hypothetical protein